MGHVKLDQQSREVVLASGIAIKHDVVFELFNSRPADSYDQTLEQALVLGSYALQLEKVGQMLDNAAREINGELMILKTLFELRGIRDRGAAKGVEMEADIGDVLQTFADRHGWRDNIRTLGDQLGTLPRRKVGDLVIEIEGSAAKIAIESKADKSTVLGDPATTGIAGGKEKSAHGQNYLALANREANFAIFVADADAAHKTLLKLERLTFLPEQPGFIAVVDRSRGDWSPLLAAYQICRELALAGVHGPEAWQPIGLIVKRISATLEALEGIEKSIAAIENSARNILDQVDSLRSTRDDLQAELDKLKGLVREWATNPASAIDRMNLYLGT